jgi:hypothetical protein
MASANDDTLRFRPHPRSFDRFRHQAAAALRLT